HRQGSNTTSSCLVLRKAECQSHSALLPLENGWQLFKRIRKMLDDLKSTDNVVRSAVILKVFGQNGWLRGSQIAGRQNRDLSRGGKGDHCRRRNPKSSPCGEAQRTPVRISNFDCSGKIATSRT